MDDEVSWSVFQKHFDVSDLDKEDEARLREAVEDTYNTGYAAGRAHGFTDAQVNGRENR